MKFYLLIFLTICLYINGFRSSLRNRSLINKKLPSIPETITDPSFNLAAGILTTGTIFGAIEDLFKSNANRIISGGLAIILTLFGGFITYQTFNLRFTFDDTKFSLVQSSGGKIGENIVVGGENSWAYKSFVNWEFLPSKSFPILVYFKETQTPLDLRVDAPIVVDNLEGQAHFFPAIANTDELEKQFIGHNCKKYQSAPLNEIELSKGIVF